MNRLPPPGTARIDAALRRLADSADMMGWMSDADGMCIYLNPSAAAVFERWEPFAIHAWTELIHPGDREHVKAVVRKAMEQHGEYRVEYRLARSDGSVRWMLGTGAARFSENGEFLGLHGAMFDITAEHKAREELKKREEQFRSLTDMSIDWWWETDDEGRFTFLSEGVRKSSGYAPETVLGRTRLELAADPAQPGMMEYMARVARREPFREIRYVACGPAEEGLRYSCISGEPVFENGVFKGYRGVGRNLTEELRAAEQLRQLGAENRALIENSFDILALLDEQGRFLRLNDAATAILGYQLQELLGRSYTDFLAPDDLARTADAIAGLRRGSNTVQDLEARWVCKDGRIVLLSVAVRWLQEPKLMYVTARDVTESHRARQQIQSSKDRLHAVLESIGDAFFAVDRDWRVTYVNRKTAEFVGRAQSALIGKILWEAVPEVLTSSVFAYYEHAMKTGEQVFFDTFYEPAGSWIEVRAYPGDDGLSVFFHDISARRDAESAIRKSEQRFRNLFEHAGDAILIVDATGCIVDANGRACRAFGYRRDELLALTVADIDPSFKVDDHFRTRLRAGRSQLIKSTKRRKDGSTFAAEVHVSRFEEDDKELFQAIIRDVTEQEEAQRKIRESEQRFREVVEMTPEGYLLTDAQGAIIDVNPALCEICGYAKEELVGNSMARVLPDFPSGAALFAAGGQNSLHGEEAIIRHKDGHGLYVLANATVKRDERGGALSLAAFLTNITERKQAEARLEQLATHDTLTGLPNRAHLNQRVQLMIDSVPTGDSMCVMFIDLDRFKEVNDSMGHEAGDLLLREVGRRLVTSLRPDDMVARLGGDEFVVAASCSQDAASAVRIAENLLDSLAEPMEVAGQEVFIGASIGISMYPRDGQSREKLFQNADMAMYRAKAERVGYRFFEPEMSVEAKTRMTLEQSLRRALERNEFELHYQPRISLQSMAIVGMEALLRWNHPQLGQVPPLQFIPIAEDTGLIDAIGHWVLEEACMQTRRLMGKFGRPLRLSVNLSARQLRSRDIPAQIAAVLRKVNLPPHLLEMELTESALIEDLETSASVLRELKKLGVLLSVDDFGTGYSGLAYLRSFPLDILKLDRSFLAPKDDGVSSFKFVKAFVDLAHTLNLSVVAEGVETGETLQFLRDAACDEAQGYFLAAPLTLDEFEAYLSRLPASRRRVLGAI